ncbi:glycosyltransferase family 2 protein [Leptospira kmetyi]|uniref:Glycosyl transferase n=1 Tax=Leptospira kmetyi TaxID=408139 RepID=A0A2M9XVD9_9LEPT|nr:glycosyltransferase family 2 protein [Leptospira kmetyi]AYV57252.1 glycosyltransferase family 2 protein [Leptospira kmetyi]PJZ29769.1 glycosyl transferase [Leptospira kmetyi]PJZ43073.1 glycosyl transferase [Leptospira kmetyi]TGK21389.1 glycosyltransferase family 2 protein [Leptospira kmetyi]TGK28316.1 glycosyltransferase family 2 protein [Leptospira kmetyi]
MQKYNIITVTYNSERYVSALNESMKLPANWNWVIWDNDSKDETPNLLKRIADEERRIVHLGGKNLGFAEGNNEAVKIAPKADWILLINPDSRLDSNFFKECESILSSKGKDYSVFSFLMLKENESAVVDGAGDIYHVSGAAWRRGYKQILSEEYLREAEIFSACGGAMAIRASVFESLGGFDSDFFCYMEDVDLSFRARLAGEKVLFTPNVKVYHHGFGSTKERSSFSLYYGLRNALVVYWKNMPFFYGLKYLFHHILFFGTSIVYHSVFTSPKILIVPFGFLRMLPGLIAKRFRMNRSKTTSFSNLVALMNQDLFSPFRKK